MNIELVQKEPHPIYEIRGYAGPNDFNDILLWLHRTDLPEDVSLDFEGTLHRFRSRPERVNFALGFDKAFDLLYDEPTLPLFIESDGSAYFRLGDAENKRSLENMKQILLQELFLTKWPEHDEDIKVYCAETYVLLIKRNVWAAISIKQKQALVNRVQGYCDALNA